MVGISDRLPLPIDAAQRSAAPPATASEEDRQRRLLELERQLHSLAKGGPDRSLAARIAGQAAARPLPQATVGALGGRICLILAIVVVLVPVSTLALTGGAMHPVPLMAILLVATAAAVPAWRRCPPEPRGLVMLAVAAALGFLATHFAVAARPLLGEVVHLGALAVVTGALVGGGLITRIWGAEGWRASDRLRHPVEYVLIAGYLLALGLFLLEPATVPTW